MSEALWDVLGADPTSWLLAADEPYARWVTRTLLLAQDPSSDAVRADHAATLSDPGVRELIDATPEWGEGDFSGHHSPAFLPNRFNLLADMGVGAGDSQRLEELLDLLLGHQDKGGRFQSFGKAPGRPRPEWGSLLCDTNAITDVALRFGRRDDPSVQRALARMRTDASTTSQGLGWKCVPEKRSLFRGPGRVNDACPQVTLEGLRAFSQVPQEQRPPELLGIARTPLEIWRRRTDERPYAFGHGYQFKSVKWPNLWYDVLWVLETVSRFPALWYGTDARREDRESIVEMAACLVAYNFDDEARVVPRRTYRGFERYSFGQKREPSPFATARALVPLVRLAALAEEIGSVDVEALPSSKGGSGVAVPPRRNATVCPTPTAIATFPAERAVPRVLARHHVGTTHEPASIESVVADVVGLPSTFPITPYLALDARLPGFVHERFEAAVYDRHALARVRTMRGAVYVVRHDLLPAALAATSRPVIRHAREFAASRGVTPERYGYLAPRALALLAERPLTTAGLRERLGDPTGVDIAALVNLLAAESLILRDRPAGGWLDRHWTYIPFDRAFPDLDPHAMSEAAGDVALLRAYVRAFGPASRRDAGWWTGMGTRRVDRALEVLGDEIVHVVLDDAEEPSLMHAADVDELALASHAEEQQVALLPLLDPLLMGYARKDRFVPDELRPYVFDKLGNACASVLVGGRVAGVWDLRLGDRPEVLLYLPGELDADTTRRIEQRAAQIGIGVAGVTARVTHVESMTPLPERTTGAFTHPLR